MGVGGSWDTDNIKLFVENLIGEFPQMLPRKANSGIKFKLAVLRRISLIVSPSSCFELKYEGECRILGYKLTRCRCQKT